MDILRHTGTPHVGDIPHSGRYPWGSGDDPNQRGDKSLSSKYNQLRAEGLSESEAAFKLGYSTGKLRDLISIEKNEEKAALRNRICRMKDHGDSVKNISEKLKIPERTVYRYLAEKDDERVSKSQELANTLKEIVAEKDYIDVGSGVEHMLDTNSSNLNKALTILEQDGYSVHLVKTKNITDPKKFTNVKVLCKPDTTWGYIQNNQHLIKEVTEFSTNEGKSFTKPQYPSSIDSSRVAVRYHEEGGSDYDGVMLIRRGCEDLSMGKSNYAQVRIAVDGTHYLKGMALYSDNPADFPSDNIDIVFNTNKHLGTPMLGAKDNTVLKPLKKSEDLPFGAVITADGQNYYEDRNGKYVKENGSFTLVDKNTSKDAQRYSLSPINKLKEEGDWNEYSRTLSSQFLAKQSYSLISQQLNLSLAEKKAEFDEIKSVTQPEIKKKLLQEFATECDAAAVDLKAAALPGQTTKVILPLTCIKDNQIYAPGYSNGTQVALIRFPHAGTFEIPILTVNNNNKQARSILGTTPIDAVGITKASADILSGADFDGDTVVVIPLSDKVQIRSDKPLFTDFDPKESYPKYEGMKVMTAREKGLEMGKISNLITDMQLQGATKEELARAVKHSMVVIDAEKHELNWKDSERVNGIDALKREYQKKENGRYGGSATLISKASSPYVVPERKQFNINQHVDPTTGKVIYVETGREYYTTKIKDPSSGKNIDISVFVEQSSKKYYYEDENSKKVYVDKKDIQYKQGKPTVLKTDKAGNSIDIPVTLDKNALKFYYNNVNDDGTKTKVYVDISNVKTKAATQESTKMAEYDDAFALSSGTKKEAAYARYANSLKELANNARLEYLNTGSTKVDPSAKKTYAKEIESLNSKIELAVLNSPKERQAQILANTKVKDYLKYDDPTSEELKKFKQQTLASARAEMGANKKHVQIDISDGEWEAIQNGAFSATTVNKILLNTDSDVLKQRAIPKNSSYEISDSQINLIRSRAKSGFTIDEIAQSMGLSSSTISKYIKE